MVPSDTDTEPLPGEEVEESYCPSCDRSFSQEEKTCPTDGTRLLAIRKPADGFSGREIDGRFRVYETIGEGGMGVVYRGWQHSVGRNVAIKVIDLGRKNRVALAKRFLREAKLASRLAHPHTVTVFDFGQTRDGVLFLVMELLKGRTLSAVLKEEGTFSLARLASVGAQLCDALDAAHRLSIIHRDLKPSNIMVLDDPPGRDFVKVLDFGLAKSLSSDETQSTVTGSGMILGTPRYMPPEAFTSESTPQSDLYSLGVILYELCTGRPVFAATTLSDMLALHALEAPPALPESVPPALAAIIMRLLEKDPRDRYQTAGEVRQALLTLTTTPEVSPRSATGVVRLGQPSHTRTVWLSAALVVVSTLAVWLAVQRARDVPASGSSGPPVRMAEPRPLSPVATPVVQPTPPPLPAPVAPAVAEQEIVLEVRSSPSAQVRINGQVVGRTPLSHHLPQGNERVTMELARSGYQAERRTIVPDASQVIEVKLHRKSRRSPTTDPADELPF
jgi:serine/threonine-protein kinase